MVEVNWTKEAVATPSPNLGCGYTTVLLCRWSDDGIISMPSPFQSCPSSRFEIQATPCAIANVSLVSWQNGNTETLPLEVSWVLLRAFPVGNGAPMVQCGPKFADYIGPSSRFTYRFETGCFTAYRPLHFKDLSSSTLLGHFCGLCDHVLRLLLCSLF